jgi:hypothetical protein
LDDAIDSKTRRNKANAPITPIAIGIALFLQALDAKKASRGVVENAFIV